MGCGTSSIFDNAEQTTFSNDGFVVISKNNGEIVQVNDYKVIEVISKGVLGNTYSVIREGTIFAMKELRRTQRYEEEILLMKQLSHHQNVVHVIDVMDNVEYEKGFVVMEYLSGGHLCEVSSSGELVGETFSEEVAKEAFRGIISAILHMHSLEVTHGNITAGNILWTDNSRTSLKICGFGSASRMTETKRKSAIYTDTTAVICLLYLVLVGSIPSRLSVPSAALQGKSQSCRHLLKRAVFSKNCDSLSLKQISESSYLMNTVIKSKIKVNKYQSSQLESSSSSLSRVSSKSHYLFKDAGMNDYGEVNSFRILLFEKGHRSFLAQVANAAESGPLAIEVVICRDPQDLLVQIWSGSYDVIVVPMSPKGMVLCSELRGSGYNKYLLGLSDCNDVGFQDVLLEHLDSGIDCVIRNQASAKEVLWMLNCAGYPATDSERFSLSFRAHNILSNSSSDSILRRSSFNSSTHSKLVYDLIHSKRNESTSRRSSINSNHIPDWVPLSTSPRRTSLVSMRKGNLIKNRSTELNICAWVIDTVTPSHRTECGARSKSSGEFATLF